MAHELGHKLLHSDWIQTSDYQVVFRIDSAMDMESKDYREKEADCFADHLLVPKFMLDRYYKIASIEELSVLFAVSMPVIRNRIRTEYGK
jgi:Zn-dependent peptidase ImmA (M78 family)